MAKGDIIRTQVPAPEIYYAKRKTGDATTAGEPVGFETDGAFVKAINSTAGMLKILTHLKDENTDTEAYMLSGEIECLAGGIIPPNSYVKVNSSSKLIASATRDVSTVGVYIKRASDTLNNPTPAADDVAIIVRVIS